MKLLMRLLTAISLMIHLTHSLKSVRALVLFAETVVAEKTSLGQAWLPPLRFSQPHSSADVTVVERVGGIMQLAQSEVSFCLGHGG